MPTPPDTAHQRIFLIRHARPLVSGKGLFDAAAARQYITDYDTAQVEEFVLRHESIPFRQIQKVFCSPLIRSRLTAQAIFGDAVHLHIDHTFREFERRIFSLPFVRLPIRLWLLSARLLWFMGFNSKGIETFRQARARARKAAELLASDAAANGTSVLVAHGLLNGFIRRELQRMGWEQRTRGGNSYLSVHLFSRQH